MYTIRDTPAITRRIDADLDVAVATVTAGDPGLRALVLTGGFARGEGAVLDGRPQNDYDLVAIRRARRSRRRYASMRSDLEARLGLHVDLAAVPAWRLPFVSRSIFWYETALRGRVLAGDANVLDAIRVRDAGSLRRDEGLRLLCNRAAGLLLATEGLFDGPTQASKAILAALDARMLAAGEFAPSQTERWRLHIEATAAGKPFVADPDGWFAWAYARKVDPAAAPPRPEPAAWKAARAALLSAVPVALRQARLSSLAAYARRDSIVDRVVFLRRSGAVPGAHRLARHPTARVRVAALQMLEASPGGAVDAAAARTILEPMAATRESPVRALQALRDATLQ